MSETQWTLAGLLIVLVGALGAYTVTKLLAAGADHEKAAVAAVTEKAQAFADLQSRVWAAKVADATTARQGEIDALQNTVLAPTALSVRKYTLSAGVPANPAPAAPSPGAAPGGVVCGGLVPGSSDEVRDFDRARAADQLTADYRLLYESWPVQPPR